MSPHNHSDHRTIRILFAGGCHVAGYPIGETASFPEIVRLCLEEDGIILEYRRLAYMKLTHAAKLQAACSEFQPDMVVLQLGHFELSRPLSQYLRSLLRFGRRPATSKSEPRACPIRHAQLFRARAIVKRSIDWILGHPLVNFAQFETQANEFLQQARHCGSTSVILLSPLPCADPLSMHYRRRATSIMSRVASRNGIEFLDVVSSFSGWIFGAERHFFDAIHLGESGHRLVGSTLAKHIITSLPIADAQAANQ